MTTAINQLSLPNDLREFITLRPGELRKDLVRVILTSGTLMRYNGGTKIYTLWSKLLRANGIDVHIATQDGSFEQWLVNPEPVISYADVQALKNQGFDVRVLTAWLDTPWLEQLVGDSQFYCFDAELKWTLHFRDKLDRYLNKNKIARIGTHSRYIQSWYMANYGIRPVLINEWSDESVFYEEPARRIAGRIGCMPDASEQDRQAFDYLARKVQGYGRGAHLIEVSGDEGQVAELLRTVDIFVGLNPGKHPFWGEGCPRTQQEALHCGCVLVAFDCLGNREYLYDDWTGLMVPSGDAGGLWRAVESLLTNPQAKERLRANGKTIAKELFSEKNKFALVASLLGLDSKPKAEPAKRITKKELSSIFPRPLWLAEEEVPYLAQAAADARNTIVEIGCAYGGSTAVFLLNKVRTAQVYSIDPFVPDSIGGVQATVDGCRYAVSQALPGKKCSDALGDWHLIDGYSHEVVGSRSEGTGFTIFAMPKAFTDAFATIQRNAIGSWMQLRPQPEIILLGDDDGVARFAAGNGLGHIAHVESNEFGTPLLSDLFEKARIAASNEICVYVNADIILMDSFTEAVEAVAQRFERFLMVGRRWDFDICDRIDFSAEDWRQNLTERVMREGVYHAPTGIDYFAFRKGLWERIPPLALGRGMWDNWLVREPLLAGLPVVDASERVMIVHQNHDFSHVPGGKQTARFDMEIRRNIDLTGRDTSLAYASHATWELTSAGIKLRPISEFLKGDNLSAALKCIDSSYRQAPDAVRRQCEVLKERLDPESRAKLLAAAKLEQRSNSACNAAGLLTNILETKDKAAAETLFMRGVQSLNAGDASQAAKYLEQAAMNCSELPNVHYALATAYAQLGDVFSAKRVCEMELTLQPDNRGAAELLERINRAVNEYRHSLIT